MNIDLPRELADFRGEVRAFIEERLPEDLREKVRRSLRLAKDDYLRWQDILAARGWLAYTWPAEHGGPGWSPLQCHLFEEEMGRASAPRPIPFGVKMLGPVICTFGSDAQKAKYLPAIAANETWWCQGYSEPNAGSDLARLGTRAVRNGDHYIVNGSKIWTTHAQFADHIFCLVRTDSSGRPQQGITFLLIPMATPGVSVEPIITLAADHEVNQVFFDDVRVPQANRVGPEHDGWNVAKYLLEFERGGGGAAVRLQVSLDHLKAIAATEREGGEALWSSPGFRARTNALDIRIMALQFSEHATLARLSRGESPGPGSSLAKNNTVEIEQQINELKLEAVHYYGMPHANLISMNGHDDPWVGPEHAETVTPRYLNSRAASIFGGAKEVQKNIVAKVVLGL